jgi:hypothetical protein
LCIGRNHAQIHSPQKIGMRLDRLLQLRLHQPRKVPRCTCRRKLQGACTRLDRNPSAMLARFLACAHHSCAQCREPERLAHEAAEAGSLSDSLCPSSSMRARALCTSLSARCGITLSSVDSDVPLAFSRHMLNIIGEGQFHSNFHCFGACTVPGSVIRQGTNSPKYFSQISIFGKRFI